MALIHNRLVKEGYGSMREVKEMDAREVLQALNYLQFSNDLERAYIEMNK